jgi:hypothetical protein
VIALGTLCNPTILAQDVALFEHNDYGGREKTFSGDTAWVGDDFNDITSSLKVSPGYCVILYEHMNHGGRSRQFCQDTPFVGDGFNDIASSFRVVLASSINTKLDWTRYPSATEDYGYAGEFLKPPSDLIGYWMDPEAGGYWIKQEGLNVWWVGTGLG